MSRVYPAPGEDWGVATSVEANLGRWFSLLNHFFTAYPTLGAALTGLCESRHLAGFVARAGIERRDQRVVLWFYVDRLPWVDHHRAEAFVIASTLSRVRESWSPPLESVQVSLTGAGSPGSEPLDFSGALVEFGQPRAEIVFPSAVWTLSRRDEPVGRGAYSTVVRAISDALDEHDASIAVVARRLRTSPRTLQRRLTGLGTTYSELLNEVRVQRAQRYLTDSQRSVSEISALLGFSEPASFYRTFKRATGDSPASFRRRRILGKNGPVAEASR